MCLEDNVDVHDIELMQYINVDCSKLKRLLQGYLQSVLHDKAQQQQHGGTHTSWWCCVY